jgi:hypothetical protein
MTDDFDRNLDTQRRRLDAMDAALAKLMSDEEGPPGELPTAPAPQSYQGLTTFNDQLRLSNSWTDVDLDTALTPAQAAALEEWRRRHRNRWNTGDIAAVGVAGVLGTASVWFDAAVDRAVRERLSAVSKTRVVRLWEKAGKKLPIDYMGDGFGGRAHRIKSAGHDLARPFQALRQIMDGEFEGIRWSFGQRSTLKVSDRFDVVSSFEEALLRWIMHMGADVLTPMSLPIPGASLLYELDNETISKLALHAYSGLRAGEGLNLRSATVAPGLTALTTEVVVRTHVHLNAMRETGTFELTHQQERKRTELRLAAHSLVGAVSLGKAAAHGLITKHPAAIRHVQVPTLMLAGKTALQVVADTSHERHTSAPTWDQLLLDLAQPWQLDLAADIDAVWPTTRERWY